jgi:hypothetical protein
MRHCLSISQFAPSNFRFGQHRIEKARRITPGFFEDAASTFSMHSVDDQIPAAQEEDRNSNEQKNRHVASPQLFALAY